jgi:hypothetical protein
MKIDRCPVALVPGEVSWGGTATVALGRARVAWAHR